MMVQFALSIIAVALSSCLALWSLVSVRRQGMAALFAALALAASALLEFFDLQALLHPESWPHWKRLALAAEGIALPGWLLFSLTFARTRPLRALPPLPWLFLALSPLFFLAPFFLPLEQYYYSPDFADERVLFLGRAGYVASIGLILFLTYILSQLERTVAALPRQDRWMVKFEIVGAGALMAIYLVYYSQGLLHRTLDMNLLPARSAALAAAAGLMAWSRLRTGKGRGKRIAVAPEVAFRSVVVLAVAFYLIGLGLLGEGMRYMGEAFPRSLLLLFGLAGGVAVVAVLLSETAKRKIRVTLAKSFYKHKYDYRAQWLAFTRSLGAARSGEEAHRAVLFFYCETFGLRGGALFLREGDLFRAVSVHEWEMPGETFRETDPLPRSFGERGWVFAARDGNPAVQAAHGEFLQRHGVAFVVPLFFDERPEGFVALGAPIDRSESFIYEDFDLMKMVAAHAAGAILSLRFSEELFQSRELAAVGRVSAFVLHDLKNLVSGLGMMAENAREYIGDPEFQIDLLEDLDGTVRKMKALMARLKDLEEKPALACRDCDLRQVVEDGARAAGSPEVAVVGEVAPARIDPVEIEKVALNLVLNALDAGGGRGPVTVEVGAGDRAWFRVTDRGAGMDPDFLRHRLFKPFETTKKKGFGIGLYQCRNIVEGHGGTIEVKSALGKGTEFTVWLPAPVSSGADPEPGWAPSDQVGSTL